MDSKFKGISGSNLATREIKHFFFHIETYQSYFISEIINFIFSSNDSL
jgi:hypothetical protein